MANKKAGQNATKHGMTSARVVIPSLGETATDWQEFRQGWHDALKPGNAPLAELVDRIAGISWRLRRCEAYQGWQAELDALPTGNMENILDDLEYMRLGYKQPSPDDKQRKAALLNAARLQDGKRIERALKYETGLERSLQRNLALYEQLQELTAPEHAPDA